MSDNHSIYRNHRQSGQALVTLPNGYGQRRDILLGSMAPLRVGKNTLDHQRMGGRRPALASARGPR